MDVEAVRAALDRVVMEHGAYIPIELMINLGLLSYSQSALASMRYYYSEPGP